TMTEGKVAKWHKNVGDTVKEGDILAEIETDKAVQDFEAETTGTLLHQGVAEGEAAPVDSVLAIIAPKEPMFPEYFPAERKKRKRKKNHNKKPKKLKNQKLFSNRIRRFREIESLFLRWLKKWLKKKESTLLRFRVQVKTGVL